MVLSQVWYELFAHEAEWLASRPDAEAIQLGRQIRLQLEDGSNLFVAWTWGPSGDDYYIGFGPNSFCTDVPEVLLEASTLPLWSPLIGQQVELAYLGERKQVLEIRGSGFRVLCCSFDGGMWGMDSLRVCCRLPE